MSTITTSIRRLFLVSVLYLSFPFFDYFLILPPSNVYRYLYFLLFVLIKTMFTISVFQSLENLFILFIVIYFIYYSFCVKHSYFNSAIAQIKITVNHILEGDYFRCQVPQLWGHCLYYFNKEKKCRK